MPERGRSMRLTNLSWHCTFIFYKTTGVVTDTSRFNLCAGADSRAAVKTLVRGSCGGLTFLK